MAKKTDRAVTQLAKELKKLRKQNEQLVKTLEKMREDQAEAHREVIGLLGERPAAQAAAPAESTEQDLTEMEETPEEAEMAGSGNRPQDAEAIEPQQEDHTPDAKTKKGPEATEAAERRANELGVDLSSIRGTGSGGRVLVKDVEAAASGEQ